MTTPKGKTFAEFHAEREERKQRIEWIWLTVARWCNVIVAVALVVMAITGVAKAGERMDRELHCLALNVYHESRGEPVAGQLAVAQVTINRADEKRRSICRIVFEPHQFSWTSGSHRVRDVRAWRAAVQVAKVAYLHSILGLPRPTAATYFHTTAVRPGWAATVQHEQTIGAHRFYIASR